MGPVCHRPIGALAVTGVRARARVGAAGVADRGAPDWGEPRRGDRARPSARPPAPTAPVRGSGGGEELEREAGADGRGGQRGRRGRSRVETASGAMVVAPEAAGAAVVRDGEVRLVSRAASAGSCARGQ